MGTDMYAVDWWAKNPNPNNGRNHKTCVAQREYGTALQGRSGTHMSQPRKLAQNPRNIAYRDDPYIIIACLFEYFLRDS